MRLIDADELRQRFIKRIQPLVGKDNSNERHEYMSWLRSVHLLDDMPTVDIVRCKDCKYFSQNDRWCKRYECGDGDRLICWDLGEDGFCSRGEKR